MFKLVAVVAFLVGGQPHTVDGVAQTKSYRHAIVFESMTECTAYRDGDAGTASGLQLTALVATYLKELDAGADDFSVSFECQEVKPTAE